MSLFRKKSLAQIQEDAAHGYADSHGTEGLNRILGVRDLTFMGIAAIVGAGIFSTIGAASYNGGPGIVLLFVFVSIACTFAAMCYAEFASMVPVSGSAYTYSYVAFGEIVAWIIGWDLLMEYAIGNIAVAISWSDYFTEFINHIKIGSFQPHVAEWLSMDYWTAKELGSPAAKAAWYNAPAIGGVRIICDLPAFLITVVITSVIYVGIKESKRLANIMVILKLSVIALVILAGLFYVRTENWNPFLPNGMTGVLSGTAAVFFAYIGFDAISTTAEECRNPQRDLPRGMFNSLIICTIIYILIALVLTGMVSYKQLNVGDPLAFVFRQLPGTWSGVIAGIVSVSAVIATASVLLVFQLGQPRIWMSMSRDGLLPPIFSRIHPKYKTPSFSTLLTGIVVGVPALFMNLNEVVNLTSVGTLFAFVLVCGGILRLQGMQDRPASTYKTPYINGRLILPLLFITAVGLTEIYYPGGLAAFFSPYQADGTFILREKVPYYLFSLVFAGTAVMGYLKRFSLIPALGFLTCSFLLSESGTTNWERFLIWLVLGMVVYFLYGRKHSRMGKMERLKEQQAAKS